MDETPSLAVTADLVAICREILAQEYGPEEWAEVESDDMFQRGPFEGGYDATEEAFTFSYRDPGGGELWFQFTLAEAPRIVSGEITRLAARPAG